MCSRVVLNVGLIKVETGVAVSVIGIAIISAMRSLKARKSC